MLVRCFFLCLIFFQLLFFCGPASAVTLSNEKRQLIDEMLKINGTDKVVNLMAVNLTRQIVSVLAKGKGSLDAGLVALVKSEVKTAMYEDFILNNKLNEIFYSLYDEYFSIKQLHAMVEFYSSSAGKQVMKHMSDLSNRSMEEANIQARLVAKKVQQRMLAKIEGIAKKQNGQKDENKNNGPVIEPHYR